MQMMKKVSWFMAGALCSALLLTAVVANASSEQMTITVGPINIMVNGEVFAPTDVNGNPVPVFVYAGSTYAPLRALAEAYGLEVGYDKETNMATVGAPSVASAADQVDVNAEYSDWSAEDEEAYQEFKGMWELEESRPAQPAELYPNAWFCKFYCADDVSDEHIDKIRDSNEKYLERMILEYTENVDEEHIMSYFHNKSKGFNFTVFKK